VLCKLQSDYSFICACVLCVCPADSAQKLNKKLGYCRDSARQRLLRRSSSFNVSDFGISRKPICDFLLMDNTRSDNLSRTVFQLQCSVLIKLSLVTGVAFLNALVLCNLSECRYISYIAKNRFFELHFCCRQCRCSFNEFDAVGFKM